MRVKLKKLIRQESLGKHVRMFLIPQSRSNVQKRSNTYFLLDTCILFWAKVLPQHESTVWLLMSYFGCGSMSQLLSESFGGDDQFQVCNFAFRAKIGLQHDTSGRLGALGRFPSRGTFWSYKAQILQEHTWTKHDKLQTTSSFEMVTTYYDTVVAFKAQNIRFFSGWFVCFWGQRSTSRGGWNLRDLHGAMSSSNRATHWRLAY